MEVNKKDNKGNKNNSRTREIIHIKCASKLHNPVGGKVFAVVTGMLCVCVCVCVFEVKKCVMFLEGCICFPDDKEKDAESVGDDMNVVTWSRMDH